MLKFRIYMDKDKETKWLNEMAERGHAMTGFFAGVYKFEKCMPGEYIYQIDITAGFGKVSRDYREFMGETGVEIVALWGYWVILRKKASDGAFELYTDTESTIEHYKKVRRMFKAVTVFELLLFMMEALLLVSYKQEYGGSVSASAGPVTAMIIIGLMTIAASRAAWKTNRMIQRLKERDGDCPVQTKQTANGLIAVGMMLNLIGALLMDSIGDFPRGFVTGFGIVLMLVGLVQFLVSERKA